MKRDHVVRHAFRWKQQSLIFNELETQVSIQLHQTDRSRLWISDLHPSVNARNTLGVG